MPIDARTSTFAELATTVLPRHMASMRVAMATTQKLTEFCRPGVGVKTILKQLGRTRDFSGCYVLLRDGKPFSKLTLLTTLEQQIPGMRLYVMKKRGVFKTKGPQENRVQADSGSHPGD